MTSKVVIILAAAAGGLMLDHLKIPAGALVGSILGTAAAQVTIQAKIRIPPLPKRAIRAIMGSYIGLGITAEGLLQLKSIAGPVAVITLGMTLIPISVGFILYKVFKWGFAEAFLGSLPAGLTEIGMNAEDFQADPIALTTVHLLRLVTILTLVPFLIKFIL